MKCTTCNGCGKVDSEEGLPWNRYLEPSEKVKDGKGERLAHSHETEFYKAIMAGAVTPVNCPTCKGAGVVDDSSKTEKSKP